MSSHSVSSGGWRVRRSIAMELDVAIYFVRLSPLMFPTSLIDLAMAIPATWIEELNALDPAISPDRCNAGSHDRRCNRPGPGSC